MGRTNSLNTVMLASWPTPARPGSLTLCAPGRTISSITDKRRIDKEDTMADISTRYLGLMLHNPVILGSSGLTGSADGVTRLEQHGAGAILRAAGWNLNLLPWLAKTRSA